MTIELPETGDPEILRRGLEHISLEHWAANRREIRGQPYSFDSYPFLREPALELSNPDTKEVVIRKAAQTGVTELALNMAVWFPDTQGEGVLYMLPTETAVTQFSAARLKPAIQESAGFQELFSSYDNVHLKLVRGLPLYLRGSQARHMLKEIAVGLVIYDEYDEMDLDVADYAQNRMDASKYKWSFWISNPRMPEYGSDLKYQNSSQGEWRFPCPNQKCARRWYSPRKGEPPDMERWIAPEWDYMDLDAKVLRCPDCGRALEKKHVWNGAWFHRQPDHPRRGYTYSQLVSPTVTFAEMVNWWWDVQGNPSGLTRFHNMGLGQPYEEGGESLTRHRIQDHKEMGFKMQDGWPKRTVIGVDVNWPYLHYWILAADEERTLKVGKAEGFEYIESLISAFRTQVLVVDGQPERREVANWAARLWPQVKVYRWFHTEAPHQDPQTDNRQHLVRMNKTEMLDLWRSSYFVPEEVEGGMVLPEDLPEEAIKEMTVPKRFVETGRQGIPRAIYKSNGPDHFASAGAFARLAQELKPGILNYGFFG